MNRRQPPDMGTAREVGEGDSDTDTDSDTDSDTDTDTIGFPSGFTGDTGSDDWDYDGLTNADEDALGTDAFNPDTDGDGLSDGDEVHVVGTNPLLADSDEGGVDDLQEILDGTDPLNPDDDGMGIIHTAVGTGGDTGGGTLPGTGDTGGPYVCFEDDLGNQVPLVYNGSTTGSGNDHLGSCGGMTAPDAALWFTAPFTGDFIFELPTSNFDAALYVRDDCMGVELECDDQITLGGERLVVHLTFQQTVLVVVDGAINGSGTYELHVNEVQLVELICDDGVDSDNDGAIDCADTNCWADPVCEEICDDNVDNNGDGLLDCFDPICANTSPVCGITCPELSATGVVPETVSGDTIGEIDDYAPSCVFSSAPDMTVEFTAPATGSYVFDTWGSSYDTALYVTDQCGGTELACNADWLGQQSMVVVPMTVGQRVIAVVDGTGNQDGVFDLNIAPLEATEQDCDDNRDLDGDHFWDCFDSDCALDPACIEICDDGIDNDQDLFADCDDPDCASFPGCFEICDDGIDNDGDGDADCDDNDCDLDPGCIEICDDGIDNDNDGDLDCDDIECALEAICLGCPDTVLPSMVPLVHMDSTVGASDSSAPSCGTSNGAGDLAFEFVAPAAAGYTFDTIGSDFDTFIYLFDTCGGVELDCDDDGGFGGGVSLLGPINLNAGQRVIVVVDGYDIEEGNVVLNIY